LRTARLEGPLFRCLSCRFVFVSLPAEPLPAHRLQHSLQPGGLPEDVTLEMERLAGRAQQLSLVDRVVEEGETPWRESMAGERLLDLRRFISEGRLLEVGCSTGEFLLVARSCFTVTGVEADQFASRVALSRGIDCRTGAIADVGLDDSSFDVAVLYHVFEHFRDPRQELVQLRRLIVPGGCLVIETPDVETIWFRLLGARWRQIIPDHLFFFSPETLRRMLGEAGFAVTEVHHVGKSMSVRLFISRIGRYSRLLARLLSALARRTGLEGRTLRLNLGDVMRVYAVRK
jgi:2-polyprenyl-3-methyl-5-hydroxy-6-metoxy-1,4-benzoquinol methylase